MADAGSAWPGSDGPVRSAVAVDQVDVPLRGDALSSIPGVLFVTGGSQGLAQGAAGGQHLTG